MAVPGDWLWADDMTNLSTAVLVPGKSGLFHGTDVAYAAVLCGTDTAYGRRKALSPSVPGQPRVT
eukprot:3497944-Rhodomonas_salina.1